MTVLVLANSMLSLETAISGYQLPILILSDFPSSLHTHAILGWLYLYCTVVVAKFEVKLQVSPVVT